MWNKFKKIYKKLNKATVKFHTFPSEFYFIFMSYVWNIFNLEIFYFKSEEMYLQRKKLCEIYFGNKKQNNNNESIWPLNAQIPSVDSSRSKLSSRLKLFSFAFHCF